MLSLEGKPEPLGERRTAVAGITDERFYGGPYGLLWRGFRAGCRLRRGCAAPTQEGRLLAQQSLQLPVVVGNGAADSGLVFVVVGGAQFFLQRPVIGVQLLDILVNRSKALAGFQFA